MGHHPVVTHRGATLADLNDGHSEGVLESLTPRERQVAMVVATGASNHQVVIALSMAAKTVECHLGHIYTKLGIVTRVQLAVAIGIPPPPKPGVRPELTPSEQQVAALVGVGMSTRLAAKHLYISPKTVEYHLARIYRKLQITSRRQLLVVLARVEANPIVALPETAA